MQAEAQDCNQVLHIEVIDKETRESLNQAELIFHSRLFSGSHHYTMIELCQGAYSLDAKCIGYYALSEIIKVNSDSLVIIELVPKIEVLSEVTIKKKGQNNNTQNSVSLASDYIKKSGSKSLGNMTQYLSGVSQISNGGSISKPVVQGLYGNRLTILNNGIAQAGQQWGSDHSPEIDPFVANKIEVVKGVGALEYPGSNLGSIILVVPGEIKDEKGLQSELRSYYETNGRGSGLNYAISNYSKRVAWRIIGTVKKNGDRSSPNYFLRNTGAEEANIAAQIVKRWNNKLKSDVYFSSFNANYGILRGSQIGNLSDLEEAIGRDVPFYTQDDFSYSIDAPFQKVNHQLLKIHSKYFINNRGSFDITYSTQLNNRKEFDVRRSGRSEVPSLNLKQWSNYFELKHFYLLNENWSYTAGLQWNRVDNTNDAETGILPLIPDYISSKYSAFYLLDYRLEKSHFEFGIRYDLEERAVATISNDVPREIIRYNSQYQNYSTSLGHSYNWTNWLDISSNLGVSNRNPEVNELYSSGLHQGVGGIEEGDPNLIAEQAYKASIASKINLGKRVQLDLLFYYQAIQNYIYLEPQDEFRLTIRGAFPVFKYKQTDALIRGIDFKGIVKLTSDLDLNLKYSFLKGDDRRNEIPLVYMPSNNIYGELNWSLGNKGIFKNTLIQLNDRFVFEQNHLNQDQDFLAAPSSYNIIGMMVSTDFKLKNINFTTYLRVENMMNLAYRDYLNRQRYFADDLGRNIVIGLNLSF